MTRPIYEPVTQSQIASQGYATRQLLRRPGRQPEPGVDGTEWFYGTSLTDWGPGETTLIFTSINGSWDSSYPTFDINGDGNLEIFKPGLYRLAFTAVQGDLPDASKTYELRLEIGIVDGPVPDAGSVNGLAVNNAFDGVRLPTFLPGFSGGAGVQFTYPVFYENTFGYENPWFPFDPTPSEIEVHVNFYEDGVDTPVDTQAVIRMWAVRYGYVWEETGT